MSNKRTREPNPSVVTCHSCKAAFPEVTLGGKSERFLYRVLLLADSTGDTAKSFFCNEFCYNWFRNHTSDPLDQVTGLTTGQIGSLLGSDGKIDWSTKDFDDVKTQTTLSSLSTDTEMEDESWIPALPQGGVQGVQGAASQLLNKVNKDPPLSV